MSLQLWVLALGPVLIMIYLFYIKDPRKEPLKTIILALIGGGIVSAVPAYYIEGALHFDHYLAKCFIRAGGSEEFCKMLAFYVLIFKHKDFDDTFDGILYSVLISLGFAGIENVMYARYYGIEIWMRAITSIPGHTCFAVFMGYYLTKSKIEYMKHNTIKSIIPNALIGLIISIIIHGTYNTISGEISAYHGLAFTILLEISAFIITHRASKNDRPFTDFIEPKTENIS